MIPAAVRAEIAEHARAELPNEACGLLLLDGDVALEYVPGENASPSPYYFELRLDPVAWADLGDRDVEQAVVHSHVSSPPRPSRTDVERIGLWRGRPYVIYSVRLDELAAWRIVDGKIEPLPVSVPVSVRTSAVLPWFTWPITTRLRGARSVTRNPYVEQA